MLLSEMFGVERDTDFGVKGYSVTFKIVTLLGKYEYLMYRWSDRLDWREAEGTMLCNIIAGAPGNIIHLPPPLTDEQMEQLRAIWTLGGKWLVKDNYGDSAVFSYAAEPYKGTGGYWWSDTGRRFMVMQNLCVCNLVTSYDPEPYDIGKALGVEG